VNRLLIHLIGWASAAAAVLLAYKLGAATAVLLLVTAALAGAAFVWLIRRRPRAAFPMPVRPVRADLAMSNTEGATGEPLAFSPVALLEATLNSMRESVVVVGPDSRIVASNAAAQALFDTGGAPLDSRRLIDITRQPAIHQAFREALESGERAEVTVETRSTDRRVFELRVAPLRIERSDRGRGAIGVFFDITRLEALERTRQEFLSNVSHELRTPLTAIMAFVETLEEGAIDDPENNWRFLEIIRKNGRRMQELIDDILDLSSIEAGNVTLELQSVRLAPLVNDVLTSIAARINGRQITISNRIAPDIRVFADQRRLEQMLTNLVDNAVKFNRDGGSVVVDCAAEERVRISVTDTGEGIAPEQLARIFERFYRVDRARSRELGGSGLGLAIVKHLARAHGGETQVRSRIGEGTVFTIELPADRDTTEPRAPVN
jgi:two-component system phosphate regulon sensor histidine kinase PhoR